MSTDSGRTSMAERYWRKELAGFGAHLPAGGQNRWEKPSGMLSLLPWT
jgi:hypothetical protein